MLQQYCNSTGDSWEINIKSRCVRLCWCPQWLASARTCLLIIDDMTTMTRRVFFSRCVMIVYWHCYTFFCTTMWAEVKVTLNDAKTHDITAECQCTYMNSAFVLAEITWRAQCSTGDANDVILLVPAAVWLLTVPRWVAIKYHSLRDDVDLGRCAVA